MKTISIISPCYNEAETIRACRKAVADLFAAGGPLSNYRHEHIFSDNASTDGTVDILREMATEDPAMQVILNARNYGPFRSNFNALRAASGDAVLVSLPIDLQDPPEMIPEFVRLWEAGFEIVAGARSNRQERPAMRTSRALFYRIVNTLSEFEMPVDVGEFQLIDRKVWHAVVDHDDHYPYIRGIIASVGFRRVIVPYNWAARTQGISKNNLPRLLDQAMNGIFSFTTAPLRACTLVGLGLAGLSLIYALAAIICYFVMPGYAPRGMTTVIAALFSLSGIQLAFIGILGEYVMSIHAQVRRRPLVVERERINMAAAPGIVSDDDAANEANSVHELQRRIAAG